MLRPDPETFLTKCLAFKPGSVIWVQTSDALEFIRAIPIQDRKVLAKHFKFLVTGDNVEIQSVSDEQLNAAGLMRIPGTGAHNR